MGAGRLGPLAGLHPLLRLALAGDSHLVGGVYEGTEPLADDRTYEHGLAEHFDSLPLGKFSDDAHEAMTHVDGVAHLDVVGGNGDDGDGRGHVSI